MTPDRSERAWRSIMRPIHVSDWETLESVTGCLAGSATFRVNRNRIIYDFHRAGGVRFRLLRKGDWINVQRPVADVQTIPRNVERTARMLKRTVERP